MNEFFDKIKNRENFYLDETTEPSITTSTLLNNSIFSRKWFLYDVDIYKMFVEDYGHDFNKYINGNDYDDVERCYLFTNANHTKCGLNCILGEKLEWLYDDRFGTDIEPTYVDKIKQYIKEHNLFAKNSTDRYVIIDENMLEDLLKKEWKCFLCYEYFDGQHNAYWIINTNKDSPLFEYVFVCSMSDSTDVFDFFHFSKMDEKMEEVEKYSRDFELLN